LSSTCRQPEILLIKSSWWCCNVCINHKEKAHRRIRLCPAKFKEWLNKKNKPRYISYSIRPTKIVE
jgi:hypothetical protein